MSGRIGEIGQSGSGSRTDPGLADRQSALGGDADRSAPAPDLSTIDRISQQPSSLDRMLAGADTLARFRDDAVPIPSSPVTQPGQISRAGDALPDAGAHLQVPAGRGPDVVVSAQVNGAANVDARLSVGTGPSQAPWVNATVQIREPGQVERPTIGLRLIGADGSATSLRSLGDLARTSGFVASAGPPTTGSLTVRGAILEITAPGGRTVLLATTDGGAVMRTGQQATSQTSAVFNRDMAGFAAPMQAGLAGMPVGLSAIGLAAGSLAGMLAMLGGTEQQMAVWLARPDGNTAAFPRGEDFQTRWSELKQRLAHDPAKLARMEAVLYDVLAARFARLGVDLAARAPAVRDVVWAMAIEHGPWAAPDRGDILSRISAGAHLPGLSDTQLIDALFAEQLARDGDGRLVHYPDLGTPKLQASVADRLADERRIALGRLASDV